MCGGIPTQRDLEIVAEFRDFLHTRREDEREVSNPPNNAGTDKGAPDLNDMVPDLDPEEYRDPLGEDDSND